MIIMKSAVLFIIFRRPDTTKRVFERIREAQPPRLYIAADGPRKDRPDEAEKCSLTRQIVENIDWPCEVHRLYRDENLGCGKGVSSAITWFFEHEEQGIIIEDDILPHIDFFRYCDEMLDRYKDDERIQLIGGRNYLFDGYHSDSSYFLTSFGHIWGWASWRRVWDTYDFDVNNIPKEIYIEKLYKRLPVKAAKFFQRIYELMQNRMVDTWDYQFAVNRFYFERYSILPFVNMIENIGFDSTDATHTTGNNRREIEYRASSPYPLTHPLILVVDPKLEKICMRNSGSYIKPIYWRFLSRFYRFFCRLFVFLFINHGRNYKEIK